MIWKRFGPRDSLAAMTQEEALRALDALPDDLRERAVARLKEQGEKLRTLKALVEEGLQDAAAGRVSDWNLEHFLAEMEDEERPEPRIATLR